MVHYSAEMATVLQTVKKTLTLTLDSLNAFAGGANNPIFDIGPQNVYQIGITNISIPSFDYTPPGEIFIKDAAGKTSTIHIDHHHGIPGSLTLSRAQGNGDLVRLELIDGHVRMSDATWAGLTLPLTVMLKFPRLIGAPLAVNTITSLPHTFEYEAMFDLPLTLYLLSSLLPQQASQLEDGSYGVTALAKLVIPPEASFVSYTPPQPLVRQMFTQPTYLQRFDLFFSLESQITDQAPDPPVADVVAAGTGFNVTIEFSILNNIENGVYAPVDNVIEDAETAIQQITGDAGQITGNEVALTASDTAGKSVRFVSLNNFHMQLFVTDDRGNMTVGLGAGTGLTAGTEQRNLYFGPIPGVAGENDALRIGDFTNTAATYIAGIASVTLPGVAKIVTIDPATGQLGATDGQSSSITITGDAGGAATGDNFTFTGGSTGLSFDLGGPDNDTFTLSFAGITANGGAVDLGTDNTTNAISIGTDGARAITVGSSAASSLDLAAGASTLEMDSSAVDITSAAVNIDNGASPAAINVATTDAANSVTIGSTNVSSEILLRAGATTAVNLTDSGIDASGNCTISGDSSASAINIATGNAAKTTTIGSTNASSSVLLQAGSTTALSVENSGITAEGNCSIAGDTSGTTVNIATGNAAKTTTIGTTNTSSTLTLMAGASSATLGNTTASLTSATINMSTGTDAAALNIGTGNANKTIVIGSTNTSSTTQIQSGATTNATFDNSGITLTAGNVTISDTNTSTIKIGATSGAKTITIGTNDSSSTINMAAGGSSVSVANTEMTIETTTLNLSSHPTSSTINIGYNDSVTKTVNIGSTMTGTNVRINAGGTRIVINNPGITITGNCFFSTNNPSAIVNIGTAGPKTITLGSTASTTTTITMITTGATQTMNNTGWSVVSSNISISGDNAAASVGIATGSAAKTVTIGNSDPSSSLVIQNVTQSSTIVPRADNTYDLGASDAAWTDIYLYNEPVIIVPPLSVGAAKSLAQTPERCLNFITSITPVIAPDGSRAMLNTEEISTLLRTMQISDNKIVARDPNSERCGIRYSALIPYLIQAVKELSQKIK